MVFSIIVPVYNRPKEIAELLQSLAMQTVKNFDVIIIDDGSVSDCRSVVESWSRELNLRYIYKENTGQGFTRNYGFSIATGDYFIVFDSDCIIPPTYLETVSEYLKIHTVDAWGGPDRAHPSFTTVQRAINYSMTSPLTTGGIRGGKKRIGQFHPRSFNMGISREVFNKTGGYRLTRMGEDIDFSMRIIKAGFQTVLIPEAYVYHKRRTGFKDFFKQLHFFGRARSYIGRLHPDRKKLFYLLPSLFVVFQLITFTGIILGSSLAGYFLSLSILYLLSLFIDALRTEGNPVVALLGSVAAFIQLTAYGTGYIQEELNPTQSMPEREEV